MKEELKLVTRLAAIDGVGGDNGVKPQHRLRHCGTVPQSFRFFFLIVIHII